MNNITNSIILSNHSIESSMAIRAFLLLFIEKKDMLLDIIDAINNKKRITFRYHDKDRTIEPYLIGLNSKGELMVRGFDISPLNSGLKLWKLTEISGLKVTEISFLFAHPTFSPKDSQIVKAMASVS